MKTKIHLSESENTIRLPFKFCIQCGIKDGIASHSFEQTEDNPIAHFAKLAGDISVIVEHILNKPHTVEAPFCRRCFDKFRSVKRDGQIFLLAFVLTIFITVLVAIYVSSFVGIPTSAAVLGGGILIGICIRIYARFYVWKNSPNISKVNKNQIVLKVPGHGKFVCMR